jgi:phospholipid/cholesterol/gamma-HCH transport system ATP-binding protein
MSAVVKIKGLCKAFGKHQVLKDFDLTLNKDENVVILGKSGSGKSVLIKCIIGLVRPDAGLISVLNEDLTSLSRSDLDILRSRIGFLFQSNALYDSMTVKENLEFPLRRHRARLSDAEAATLVMEALENVGLAHTLNMRPSELSGGMKKRIALARTLILKPEIILYDEPTTGLDPITAKEISMLMRGLAKKYSTSSIIISHDLNCVQLVADRVVMLIEGRCYASGTLSELKQSQDPKIKSFFE